MRSIKIRLNETQYQRCLDFAERRLGDTELYSKRGGFKKEDLVAGAMGEIGAWKYLKRRGFPDLSKPDFTIYEKGQKSYKADLRSGARHFHVKAQTVDSVKKYGSSWLMQRHDPLFKGITYNNYMLPCVVNIESKTVELFGCITFKSIIEGDKVGECKVPQFRTNKVAIYLDDLLELSHNQRWRAFNMYGGVK